MRGFYIYLLGFLIILSGLCVALGVVRWSAENTLYLVIGIFLGLLTFARPELGLYFMLLSCYFFPEIPIGMAGRGMTEAQREIGIRPDDILISLIAIGWFVRLVSQREIPTIPQSPLHWPIMIVSAIFVLATLLGVWKGSVSTSAGFFFTLKKLQYFLIFFMVLSVFTTMKEIKTAVVILLFASAVIAIWGIIAYHIQPELRVASTFQRSQANILGGFFLITMFLALSFLINYPSWGLKMRLIILLLLSLGVIAFTRSRSTYVSFFLGLIIFSILSRRYILIAIPIILLILIPVLPAPVRESARTIRGVFQPKKVLNPSWEVRKLAWQKARPLILKSPLLGYGLGSYDLAWTDNQYVTDMLSIGIIGTLAFLWLLLILIKALWRMSRDSPNLYTRSLALGFLVATLALMIQGIAVANFYTIRIMTTFCFMAGLLMLIRHIELSSSLAKEKETESAFEST